MAVIEDLVRHARQHSALSRPPILWDICHTKRGSFTTLNIVNERPEATDVDVYCLEMHGNKMQILV